MTPPGFRIGSVFIIAVAMSIGWGIRGNFGHEYGSMMAGCMAAIAGAVLSGREDWRQRVGYFALFGGLGWGFGGSMSYMQVVTYTASGHFPSQLYGFFGVFALGFLWAAPGGAGTALPAVMDRDRLTRLFGPLAFVLVAWAILAFITQPLAQWLAGVIMEQEGVIDRTWNRHRSPLYWMDSDWLQALTALMALGAYDLWNRRERNGLLLPLYAALGAMGGFLLLGVLQLVGLAGFFGRLLTRPLGDPNSPVVYDGLVPSPEQFLTNWPQFFHDLPQHLGWGFGLLLGCFLYFRRFGRWENGASLFLYMAIGWWAAFLAFPVLGSLFFQGIGGLAMTPPRGDNWAGVLGVIGGILVWMQRNGLAPVNYATLVTGFLGGIGFATVQLLKLLAQWPGSGYRHAVEEQAALRTAAIGDVPAAENAVHAAARAWWAENPEWLHWHSANWHSIMEQGHGFFHGIAIAVMLALLATRVPYRSHEPRVRRWTEIAAVLFVVVFVVYLNLQKNVSEWVRNDLVPESMSLPLVLGGGIEWRAETYFALSFLLLAIAGALVLRQHQRQPIAVIPETALGKGQLLFLVFVWAMVIGNFERALPNFSEQRLITEWAVFLNAAIASTLLLLLPRQRENIPIRERDDWRPAILRVVAIGVLATIVSVGIQTGITRKAYGDLWAGHAGWHMRIGEYADWRIKPNLKSERHR